MLVGILGAMRPKMVMKISTNRTVPAVMTALCGFVMLICGCVMQSTYDAAVQEGLSVRTDLAQVKDEQKMLARQVREMELMNADVMREAESSASALQQAKDDAEQERQQAAQRIAKLQQKVAQATKQQRSLQYELTVAKENTSALQELIDVYQRKVRDGAVSAAETFGSEPTVHKPFDPSAIPIPQDLPAAPAVTPPQPVQPPVPAPAPAASPVKPHQPPPDESWLSSITNWLVSLWHSVFS